METSLEKENPFYFSWMSWLLKARIGADSNSANKVKKTWIKKSEFTIRLWYLIILWPFISYLIYLASVSSPVGDKGGSYWG